MAGINSFLRFEAMGDKVGDELMTGKSQGDRRGRLTAERTPQAIHVELLRGNEVSRGKREMEDYLIHFVMC